MSTQSRDLIERVLRSALAYNQLNTVCAADNTTESRLQSVAGLACRSNYHVSRKSPQQNGMGGLIIVASSQVLAGSVVGPCRHIRTMSQIC